MKKLLFLLLFGFQIAEAQTPQSFKYQSVVRDGSGVLAVNKIISIRTSMLAGSTTGSSVYTETQTLSTNDYGVVSLNIGAGTLVSGNFSTINWGATTYFVKTELDINGGTNYIFMGTSQILSVPYALYAEKAGNALADHDTSATNELQTITKIGNQVTLSQGGGSVLDSDNQTLTKTDSIITLSNGGGSIIDKDNQTLVLTGNTLSISYGNSLVLSGAIDLDSDPTNELQTLSRVNDTLKISLGNNVVFPHDNDRDSTNELQTLLLTQGSLKISNKNTVHLPDSSATNELQTLSITQGSLSVSQKNTIHLPDSSATNELQNLSVAHDSISITLGNKIYINTTRSLKFPEGIDGEPMFLPSGFTNYTVPAGKNLYILSCDYSTPFKNAISNYEYIDGTAGIKGLPVIKEGETITAGKSISAMLVNKISDVEIVQISLTNQNSFTIPLGKTFYLKSYKAPPTIGVGVNSWIYSHTEVTIIPSGTVLTYPNGQPVSQIITGYYK